MAKAIVSPLLERGEYNPQQVLGIVGSSSSVAAAFNDLPKEVKIVSSDDSLSREVWKAPLKILAVKPQQFSNIKESVSLFQSNDQFPKPDHSIGIMRQTL